MAHATRWSPNLGKWRKSVQLHMIPFNLGVETLYPLDPLYHTCYLVQHTPYICNSSVFNSCFPLIGRLGGLTDADWKRSIHKPWKPSC